MKKFLCIGLALMIVLQGFMVFATNESITCSWKNNTVIVTAPNGTFRSGSQVDMVVLMPEKTLEDVTAAGTIVCTSTSKANQLGGVSLTQTMKAPADGDFPVYLIPSSDDAVVKGVVSCRGTGIGRVTIASANKDGAVISVTVAVTGAENGTMCIAAYDRNDCLVDVDLVTAVSGTYTLTASNAVRVKAMIWESANTCKPIALYDDSPL